LLEYSLSRASQQSMPPSMGGQVGDLLSELLFLVFIVVIIVHELSVIYEHELITHQTSLKGGLLTSIYFNIKFGEKSILFQ